MIKANGTVAKDIAIYFLGMVSDRYTPSMVSRTVVQAKQLLESGYTQEEIIKVIDYICSNTSIQMYSLGYVQHCINDVLTKIEEEENKEKIKQMIEQSKLEQASSIDDGSGSIGKSKENNRNKLGRFGIQSRFREKFDFDLFEGK